MIAGFNTDIEYEGVVYHVQTEDKGAPAHVLMSLVYDKGTILASKRSAYDSGLAEKELGDLLSRQHKLICAAVNSGRISDLVEMTRRSSKYASKPEPDPVPAFEPALPLAAAPPITATPAANLEAATVLPPAASHVFDAPPVPEPPGTITFDRLPVIDAVEIIEDLEILPDEAVAVVSEFSGQERPKNSKLSVELLGDLKFKGGERKTVDIMVCRGTDRKVVPEAQIMVKVLGSSFRPVIFHARSNVNGLAKIHLQLPHFDAGRAALLIRALSDGQEIELRRLITPG